MRDGFIYTSKLAFPSGGLIDQYSYSLGTLNNVSSVYTNVVINPSSYGRIWKQKISGYWYGVSISSTGLYQTAVQREGEIYTSSDYGMNWTSRYKKLYWRGVSVSSTGLYQTAVQETNGRIYTSSNYGVNWIERDSSRNWQSVSISSTGMYQTAGSHSGQIYTSSDYGVNWTGRDISRNWYRVSMSADGIYQTAVLSTGYIYTSNNYGVNWTARMTDINRSWAGVSMSANGLYQTAHSDYIYISTNYGVNWIARADYRTWNGVSVSSDGLYQTVVPSNSTIHISATSFNATFNNYNTFNLDTGSTFFLTSVAPNANYTANFTITTLNTERTYLIMLINNTSTAASFYCTSITINGIAVSIYNVVPTLTSAVVTCQEISLFYNSTASAWQADSIVKNYQAA